MQTNDGFSPNAVMFIDGCNANLPYAWGEVDNNLAYDIVMKTLINDNSQTRIVVSDANGNLSYRDASSLALNETMDSDLAVNGRVSAQ